MKLFTKYMGGVLAVSLVATAVCAETITWKPFDTGTYGTAQIAGDSSGPTATLTVDVLRAGITNITAVGDLEVGRDLTVVGSAAVGTNLTVAGTATVTGDVSGQDITATGNLAVTTNAAVGGTLGVTGVATFTEESVHNGGIDADGITVDAGDGIDTKAEGTLLVGDTTANKIEIGLTAVETEIQGTLDVIEAADFDAAVTMGTTLAVTGDVSGQDIAAAGNLSATSNLTVTVATVLNGSIAAGDSTNDVMTVLARILASGMPTDTNGLATGTIWSDDGTLKLTP